MFAPLSVRDVIETMREQGIPEGAALGLVALFGASLQTFDVRKRKNWDHRSTLERMKSWGFELKPSVKKVETRGAPPSTGSGDIFDSIKRGQ